MKKPFKETKLGQILSNTLPSVLDIVGDVLPDAGVLGIVKNIIDKEPSLTAEQKVQLNQQVQEYEKELFSMDLEDRKSARDLQIHAMAQEDKFSKHFIFYLSSFVLVSATAFGVMLFYIEFPEANRRLIEMFADLFLFSGAVTVINFFLGSSKSSVDKNKLLKA